MPPGTSPLSPGSGVRALALAFSTLLLLTCGGRPELPAPTQDTGSVSGTVFLGPIQGATLRVFRVVRGERGALVGQATTAEDGSFRVGVGLSGGPFLLTASGGSFVDAASGTPVGLHSEELTALVPHFPPGSHLEGVRVSAVSHLAAGLALRSSQRQDALLEAADADAWLLLSQHFGVDFRSTTPLELSSGGGPAVNAPARAGLVLAGLSMHSRLISEQAGLTPGGSVNPLTLTRALYLDASADGVFDGFGASGRLLLPEEGAPMEGASSYLLGGATLRAHLAQAIAHFLASERNASAITLADAQGYLSRLAESTVPRLFPPGEPIPADLQPPHLAFLRPVNGAGVNGQVLLTVRAVDDTNVASLRFTAPPELAQVAPVFDSDGRRALLTTTWDVSSLPEGPVRLSVETRDSAGHSSREELTVQVAHQGPSIFVDTPADGSALRGTLTLTARAQARQVPVAKLFLVNAAALGVGGDEALEASSFRAAWDTTLAPEGDVALHFRAEDRLGIRSDFSVLVKVDNVPLGHVSVVASAGAPLPGATVRLVAVDDTTGEPVLGRPGGAILGQGTTDTTGTARFTLSQLSGENWDGPVQLLAAGSAVAYVDPSSSAQAPTVVSLSASPPLTSYLPRYRSGQALSQVPLTLWTSLADAAALSLTRGHHRSWPAPRSLSAALSAVDPLMAQHLVPPTRDTWSLREALPLSLTSSGSPTLRDAVYAALPDVALNQLARETSLSSGYEPGTAFTAMTLLRLLREDLLADGQFDGLGEEGRALAAPGQPSYALSANTTRADLAAALDRFITSPQQKLGLTRAAMEAQGIYDALSSDTSFLYPASPQPGPGDAQPPSISFSASYEDVLGAGQAPRLGRYVHGLLSVTVAATDADGVAALAVRLNGALIPPAPGSTTSRQHFVYQLQGQPDGALLFEATARDSAGNTSAPQRLSLLHDNSPPTLSTQRPLPGAVHGPAGVPVAAAAADSGSGVASLRLSGLGGFTDSDARPEVLAGTWENPPEGPATLHLSACDLLSNCAATQVPFSVDRTAPVLTVVSTPAEYVNTPRVRFTVAAVDSGGSSVAAVRASNGSRTFSGQPELGLWAVEVELAEGLNTFSFWAEDAVGNSSEADPANPRLSVVLDTRPPVLQPLEVASFFSEEGMLFEEVQLGVPRVPAVYTFPAGATKRDAAKELVLKASTRLSYGTPAPSLSQLEQQNPALLNVPFLLFHLDNSAGGAPLASLSYELACTPAAACAGVSAGQAPLLSEADSHGTGRYLLPISQETVTHLGALAQEVSLTFTLRPTDTAGNSTLFTTTPVRFRLVAPRLSVSLDSNYHTTNDPRSTFPYTLSAAKYHELFDPTGASNFPDGAVRLVRFRVYNPAPVPVGVSLGFDGTPTSFTGEEVWESITPPMTEVRTFGDADGCGTEPGPHPCTPRAFEEGPEEQCLAVNPDDPATTKVTAQFKIETFIVKASTAAGVAGQDIQDAATAGAGIFIVPPASATGPGALNVYVARPFLPALRTVAYPLTAPPYVHDEPRWFKMVRATTCKALPLVTYQRHEWKRTLFSIKTTVRGNAKPKAHAIAPGGNTLLGAHEPLPDIPFETTIPKQ
jgi:hypothetical protein